MYGSEKALDGSDRTAFRKAEKKYKLYYDDSSKSSKKYLLYIHLVLHYLISFVFLSYLCLQVVFLLFLCISLRKKRPKEVDLSEVLDFNSVLESYSQNGDLLPGIIALQCDFDRPVFCLERRPGIGFFHFRFYFGSTRSCSNLLWCIWCCPDWTFR